MSAADCARAASDLTALVHRLGRTRAALVRQSRLSEEHFGGLSGDAYRRHAARSAVVVAGAGSDLALLAGALAALGRGLASAEELRDRASVAPPDRARELRRRARDLEHRAQERWRTAVATYGGPACAGPPSSGQPVVGGTVLAPSTPPSPSATPAAVPVAEPAVGSASEPAPTTAPPPAPPAPPPQPVLESAFVTPPPALESELVTAPVPAAEPPHCGTPEVLDGDR